MDNGSTDDTRARLQAEWPAAHLESFPDNRGFAEACNRGVSAGQGEFVVLLNNDVDCRVDFLEALVAPLEQDPRMGAVAALMLQPGEHLIDSAGLAADVTSGGVPAATGAERARGEFATADPRRPSWDGRRLPPLSVGAGRRVGRGDLRLHGGFRPRPAATQRGLGRRLWQTTPRGAPRLGHARAPLGLAATPCRLWTRLSAAPLRPAARDNGTAPRSRPRSPSCLET